MRRREADVAGGVRLPGRRRGRGEHDPREPRGPSNGRQLDGAVASLYALPGVVEAVNGRVPVLLDSGIRRGADVSKALALGARAVCIGRPYVYGLTLAGQAGVHSVISDIAADLELSMGLAGCRSASELSTAHLARDAPDLGRG